MAYKNKNSSFMHLWGASDLIALLHVCLILWGVGGVEEGAALGMSVNIPLVKTSQVAKPREMNVCFDHSERTAQSYTATA